ncbi:cob(I)yrinic acid a,c-diamide adenosyltransferase [Bacillaceae bacterium Marseille-Q3522]|nr:cob(I)yrinic acid a,c-diamide adenosyltransferase [Bacillaceae bacterium Marseille-Q3522]
MSIYTKKGDKGSTSLYDGVRVKKYDLRVDTYGTFDELNAQISVAAKFVTSENNRQLLEKIEYNIFYLCAELATEKEPDAGTIIIEEKDVRMLETEIDRIMKALPKVNSFILPGQSKAAAFLHVARTVTRRGERLLTRLAEQIAVRPVISQFVNRLSDFFYAMAREEDTRQMLDETVKKVVKRYMEQQPQAEVASTPFLEMLHAAIEEAERIHVPVTVAIVDDAGNLILTYRMPQALLVSVKVAPKKAYTAVAMQTATHELTPLVQPEQELYQLEAAGDGKLVTFGGGFPIKQNGKLIGGLGISGGAVEEDMQIGRYALSILEKR